jgi:hypothetical protein
MADSFFPDSDAGKLKVAQSFSSAISSSPSTYALSPSDAQIIAKAVNEYAHALQVASEELTRTPPAVNAKDTARNAMESLIRVYVNQIRANQGITDQSKIDAGIQPWKTTMTPRQCPLSSPQLSFVAATPGVHVLHFCDSLTPNDKKKPFGATRLELFMALIEPDAPPPTSPRLPGTGDHDGRFDSVANWAWYVNSYSRTPISVAHPNPPRPMCAVYWGRWANNKGEVGQFSNALPTMLVGRSSQLQKSLKQAA